MQINLRVKRCCKIARSWIARVESDLKKKKNLEKYQRLSKYVNKIETK